MCLINISLLSVVLNTSVPLVWLVPQTLLLPVAHFPLEKSCLLKFVICELKKSNSAGPDSFKAKFVKLASHIIMYPLADLFNLSLSICSIPPDGNVLELPLLPRMETHLM